MASTHGNADIQTSAPEQASKKGPENFHISQRYGNQMEIITIITHKKVMLNIHFFSFPLSWMAQHAVIGTTACLK